MMREIQQQRAEEPHVRSLRDKGPSEQNSRIAKLATDCACRTSKLLVTFQIDISPALLLLLSTSAP